MSNGEVYKGSCFCGAVEFKVSGEPAGKTSNFPEHIERLIAASRVELAGPGGLNECERGLK